MADFLQWVATLREHMHAELSRTDVLRVLIWPILILLITITTAAVAHAPSWLLIVLTALVATFLLLYAASFVVLLFKDRDALRSEKYSLQKMAIEHGLFGDSGTGLRRLEAADIGGSAIEASPPAPERLTDG